ncbi:hypothetical protein [Mycolicibacterium fortuitum]|uniref:hypothetical protein n=1 Tax=Mycolicibacterium fortuitum TaxID=1766 RepID=UPI00096F75A9|nr:hypothetical protein [Mycolicibacterium fortuitum]OMC02157.1 hypothetical protein A5734_14930 [Mycolicibacterium fortuitum]
MFATQAPLAVLAYGESTQSDWNGFQWFVVFLIATTVIALAIASFAFAFSQIRDGYNASTEAQEREAYIGAGIAFAVGILMGVGAYYLVSWALRHAEWWLTATPLVVIYLAAGFAVVWVIRWANLQYGHPRRKMSAPLMVATLIVSAVAVLAWANDTEERWNRVKNGTPNYFSDTSSYR